MVPPTPEIAAKIAFQAGVTAYKAGDLYRRSLVQDTQRRLYGMELFQFANVQALDQDLQPAEVPTRIS